MDYRKSRSTSPLLVITPNIDLDLIIFDRLLFLTSTEFSLGEFHWIGNLPFYVELSLFRCKATSRKSDNHDASIDL